MQFVFWVPVLVVAFAKFSYLHCKRGGRHVSNVGELFVDSNEHFDLIFAKSVQFLDLLVDDSLSSQLLNPFHLFQTVLLLSKLFLEL